LAQAPFDRNETKKLKNLFSGSHEPTQYAIFVLTNEDSIIQKIVGTLQAASYQVQSATSGEAAMVLLDQPPFPDMLILDYAMPEMDTSEFLGTVRQRFGRSELPPVLLLAGDSEGEAAANQLQVEGYLQKPFDNDQLLAHVLELLDKKQRP
jgi:CheY-like chemotaxis protein